MKEKENGCAMWIDFSDESDGVGKSSPDKTKNDVDNSSEISNLDNNNKTYIIDKETSQISSPDSYTSNHKTADLLNTAICELGDVNSTSPINLQDDIRNGNYTYSIPTTTHRRSSSTLFDTLRKLICMNDR